MFRGFRGTIQSVQRAANQFGRPYTSSSTSEKPRSEYIKQMTRLYPTKRFWPPDFSRLSGQEQLRYEKKYKRRVKLATRRPRWNKFIKLVQLYSITGFIIYAVLFMDWKDMPTPLFDPLRIKFWNLFGQEYVPNEKKMVIRLPPDHPNARP